MKPNPTPLFESHLVKMLEEDNDVLCLACSSQVDNSGNRFILGFVQTSRPTTVDALKTVLGSVILSLFLTIEHQESLLTEIHVNSCVFEFGDTRASNFEEKKAKILAFKVCADATFAEAVNEIERKCPDTFQNHLRLVLRYLKS